MIWMSYINLKRAYGQSSIPLRGNLSSSLGRIANLLVYTTWTGYSFL